MRSLVLSSLIVLGCSGAAGSAAAQTAPCDQCVVAKLNQLNTTIDAQTTEVKSIRRLLEKLPTTVPVKSAVVIEFGSGVTAPNGFNLSLDNIALRFCQSINYSNGKALVGGTNGDITSVIRLVCYM